jgi:nucleoid-associated protein YgaU
MALSKAYFQTDKKSYTVQFNPASYSISKSADWAEAKADHTLDAPLLEWKGGKSLKMEMTLFFDTYEAGEDVRDLTMPIEELSMVNDESHGPPLIKFHWGDYVKVRESHTVTWLLTSFNTTYTMFTEEGKPVRAEMKVSLTEFVTADDQKARIRLQSPDHEKAYRVQPGDTLQAVANQAYGDPTLWRPIATANNIEDPRSLEAGAILRVPRIR